MRRLRYLLALSTVGLLTSASAKMCLAEDHVRYLPVTATASPQPNPQKHVRVWNVTVCNDGLEPVTVNDSRLIREFGDSLSFLNIHARTFAQGRTRESILTNLGDLGSDLSISFVAAVGTGAIEYSGKGLPIGLAIFSGAWKIGKRYLAKRDDRALTDQPFWDERQTEIGAGSQCVSMAMAALRPEDRKYRKELEKKPIEVMFKDRSPRPEPLPPVFPTIAPASTEIDQDIFLSFYRFEDRETSVVF